MASSSSSAKHFPVLNRGYARLFQPGRLTIGLVAPVENEFAGPVPAMTRHVERIQLAEELGFAGVWLRDVPWNVPSFGDAGQIYDPFVYLGLLAGQTKDIALGVASLVLPLRHPAHLAKAAASVDQLSGGRMVAGIASGDRPEEYPAMNLEFDDRADRFRASYDYISKVGTQSYPVFENAHYGSPRGNLDMVPHPTSAGGLPLLITGSSRQTPDWIARHAHGWITYPRPTHVQAQIIQAYRNNMDNYVQQTRSTGSTPTWTDKPVVQSLYIDLTNNPHDPPRPIHLGFRSGINYLLEHLHELEQIGVNHVALNLRFQSGEVEDVLRVLAQTALKEFPTTTNIPTSDCPATTNDQVTK